MDEPFNLQERLIRITQAERNPRFYTYRDQVPEAVSDSSIYRALRNLVAEGVLVRKGPVHRRYWNMVTERERI